MNANRNAGRFGFALGGLLAVLGFAACQHESPGRETGPTVGQSGSEGIPSGGNTVPCPCGLVEAANAFPLRVTLLAQDEDVVSLRVEELLGDATQLAVGDVLTASRYDDTLACYLGCSSLKVGDQAFAFYAARTPPLPACAARAACEEACGEQPAAEGTYLSQCACREKPASRRSVDGSPTCGSTTVEGVQDCKRACAEDMAERCPPRPEQDYKTGSVRLSPWADRILFARGPRAELSVSAAELKELWGKQDGDYTSRLTACMKRFGDWSQLLQSAP